MHEEGGTVSDCLHDRVVPPRAAGVWNTDQTFCSHLETEKNLIAWHLIPTAVFHKLIGNPTPCPRVSLSFPWFAKKTQTIADVAAEFVKFEGVRGMHASTGGLPRQLLHYLVPVSRADGGCDVAAVLSEVLRLHCVFW